jgi:ABC-type multidrug transport system permease subunit
VLLLIFAAIGFFLGRQLGMTPRGFVTISMVSIGATGLQIAHLATAANRSALTMLPIVVGAVVVATMLLGALVRRPSQSSTAP